MGKCYKIGSRGSLLALKQVEEAVRALRSYYGGFSFKIIEFGSPGDRDRKRPVCDVEGSDFWTSDIDCALLNADIDFAVHSAKDLPDNIPEGLAVAAVTDSIDLFDVLVSRKADIYTLDTLPERAEVATSSIRRKKAIKGYREDLRVPDLRGNVDERVRMLDEGRFDAIVIAAAGLLRLGMEERISQRIPFDILSPHPLQGSLAVLTGSDDRETSEMVSVIDSRGALPWR